MVIGQRVLFNVGFGDDLGIWEGFIVYKVLYLMFEVEEIVSFMAKFLLETVIFIEVPSGRSGIRHRCRV